MKKALITATLLAALLLSGCANSTNSESILSDSVSENISSPQEPEIDPNTTEAETEDHHIYISPYPELMYNGELYTYGIYSAQTELDGKYYEADIGVDAFIDAESLKNECEYIGESIPNADYLVKPSRELEVTYSDEVYELYKIDEDQILLYSAKDLDIPDTWRANAVVYPGTFRRHYILIKADKYDELIGELEAKYYRSAPDSGADNIEFTQGAPVDKNELGSFVYDSVLEFVKNDSDNGLNILTENAELYDIYASSLALSDVIFSNGDSFPTENFGEGRSFNDLPQINVNGSDILSCAMVTYDSFYGALTDVFTKEAADKMLEMQSRSFREYDGALWITMGTGYIDTKIVHEEYVISENDGSVFDILITAYLVDDNRAEEFDPERADEYEKQTFHYTILKTENGWRVSDFPVYSFSGNEAQRVQISDI